MYLIYSHFKKKITKNFLMSCYYPIFLPYDFEAEPFCQARLTSSLYPLSAVFRYPVAISGTVRSFRHRRTTAADRSPACAEYLTAGRTPAPTGPAESAAPGG